jgi:hypothetical protein
MPVPCHSWYTTSLDFSHLRISNRKLPSLSRFIPVLVVVAVPCFSECLGRSVQNEVDMYSSNSWTEGLRRFLGLRTESKALEILRQLYVEKSQHAVVFAEHASRMHYPSFVPSF